MASVIKFSIGVVICILMMKGAIEMLLKINPNKCEMTYMFQNPQFIKINIPNENISTHKYSLYAYGEGLYAEELKKGSFNGIPVLFIPGNQGSYKQVRSLASVAYRKADDEKHLFHFNFFAVDFNEEPCAFYGPVLKRQTQFVGFVMRRILELYKNAKRKPSSIILVGHSLGGLVARAVLLLPEIPASQVPLLITQATPHSRPIVVLDPDISEFYNQVNRHWKSERFGDFVNSVFISIGGGRNDIQVSTLFTTSEFSDVDATTLSVPSCWLTTDHLAIVWCRQLVLATVRAMFDSIDPSTHSVSKDRTLVVNAFKFQLEQRGRSKHSFSFDFPTSLTDFDKNGIWTEAAKLQNKHESLKPSKHTFVMIPFRKNHGEDEHLTVIGKELDWKNWVFACTANVRHNDIRICTSGMNLSPLGRLIPGNKKEVNINLKELDRADYTHVVIWIHPSDDKVQVAFDISNSDSRHKTVDAPSFMSSFSPIVVSEKTPSKALSYNLTINGLTEYWQSYILYIVPSSKSCTSKRASHPYVSISSSWNQRWEYLMNRDNPFEFPIEVDVPFYNNSGHAPTVQIHIILYQNCTYKISFQKSLFGIFKRISFLYGPQFPAFMACQFLLVLATQLKSLASTKKCSSVFSSILTLSPVAVVPFTKLLSYGFQRFLGIDSDSQVLADHRIDLGVLPLVLFLSILPLSLLVASALWILVIGFGKAAHSFAVKILKRTIRTGDIMTEIVIAGFWKMPAIVSFALIALALGSCGALALCIGSAFYFVKVFKMYEDYLESFFMSLIPGSREVHENQQNSKLSSIHLHFTMMILSMLVSLLNLPSLIMWSSATMSGAQLPSDPSLIPCLLSLLSHGVMWQIQTINPQKKFYKELGYLFHASAVLVIMFGTINLYRISYILTFLPVLFALHQLLAPCDSSQENLEDSIDKEQLPHMKVVDGENETKKDI